LEKEFKKTELEKKTSWSTPQKFFDILNEEFRFTLDVCASVSNTKCVKFHDINRNALKIDWTGNTFWMNPPYGRGIDVYSWVEKAYLSAQYSNTTGVCLLPGSIDTKWFHHFCMNAVEIRIVRDRLWFSQNGVASRANHGSIVVVFSSSTKQVPRLSGISNGR
jgi:phage N-6-adenine-methyltransferase